MRPNSREEQINRRIERLSCVIDRKAHRFEIGDRLIPSPAHRHPFIELKIYLPLRIDAIEPEDLSSWEGQVFLFGILPVSDCSKKLAIKNSQCTNLGPSDLADAGIA